MIFKHYFAILVAALFFSTLTSAQAATIEFGTPGSTDEETSFSFTEGPFSVTATTPTSGSIIHQAGFGLGVKEDGALNNGQQNAINTGEEIEFDFGTSVIFQSMELFFGNTTLTGDEQFNLFLDDVQLTFDEAPGQDFFIESSAPDVPNGRLLQIYGFADGISGTVLRFEGNGSINPEFRVSNITVVPVPAAVWLLGSGLLGLIGLARRK